MNENELSKVTIDSAMKVHSALGPGLLESVYESCLEYELNQKGLFVERQKSISVEYQKVKIDCGFRLDLFVERKLILELKAVEALNDIHLAQTLTYLKLTKCKLALLINFNVVHLKDGLKRVVNNL
jgi:GxxExxY protein